jgi:hypothetical protein
MQRLALALTLAILHGCGAAPLPSEDRAAASAEVSQTVSQLCRRQCPVMSLRDSVQEVQRRSSLVFTGRAASFRALPGEEIEVTFLPSQWFKGSPQRSVVVIDPCRNCVDVRAGDEYLVYAYDTPDGPMINPHTRSRPLSTVSEYELAQLGPKRAVSLSAEEQQVLEAALGAPGRRTLVRDETFALFITTEPDAFAQQHSLPLALTRQLLLRNERERASLAPLGRRDALRLESARVLDTFFENHTWETFQKRFDAGAVYGVSLPVISGDRALVYRTLSCGLLCGEGTILRLRKEAAGWKVVQTFSIWVS